MLASLVVLCLSACTDTLRILCPCTPTKPNIVVDVSVVCVVTAGQYSIFVRAKSQRTEQTIEKNGRRILVMTVLGVPVTTLEKTSK